MDRLIDAVDEWLHRRGLGVVKSANGHMTVTPWWGHLVRPLCDYRERRLIGAVLPFWVQDQNTATTTTANTATYKVTWFRFGHRRSHRTA